MSEYNTNENLQDDEDYEIKNKPTLDKEKIVDRVLVSVLIVFCIVLTVLGIDIEKKLKIINEKEPVVISSLDSETSTDIPVLQTSTTVPDSTTEFTRISETISTEAITSVQQLSTESTQVIAEITEPTTISETTQQPTTATTTEITTIPTTIENTTILTTAITTQPAATKPTTTKAETTKPTSTQKQTTKFVETTATKPQADGKYYITASGTKYHISTCSYLSKTKIEIELDEAIEKGYTPCSRCIK